MSRIKNHIEYLAEKFGIEFHEVTNEMIQEDCKATEQKDVPIDIMDEANKLFPTLKGSQLHGTRTHYSQKKAGFIQGMMHERTKSEKNG